MQLGPNTLHRKTEFGLFTKREPSESLVTPPIDGTRLELSSKAKYFGIRLQKMISSLGL